MGIILGNIPIQTRSSDNDEAFSPLLVPKYFKRLFPTNIYCWVPLIYFVSNSQKFHAVLKRRRRLTATSIYLLYNLKKRRGRLKALLYHQSHSPEKRTLGGYAITITINSPIVRFFQIGKNPKKTYLGSFALF